jgi:hypothetical protein
LKVLRIQEIAGADGHCILLTGNWSAFYSDKEDPGYALRFSAARAEPRGASETNFFLPDQIEKQPFVVIRVEWFA